MLAFFRGFSLELGITRQMLFIVVPEYNWDRYGVAVDKFPAVSHEEYIADYKRQFAKSLMQRFGATGTARKMGIITMQLMSGFTGGPGVSAKVLFEDPETMELGLKEFGEFYRTGKMPADVEGCLQPSEN